MSEPIDAPALPAIASAPISVLLLAHNDQAHLGTVIESWVKQLGRLEREYQIIVVDDGSSDRTAEIAQGLAKQHSGLTVLTHTSPRGSGAALKTGMAAALHPLLLYTTCDPQYRAVDFQLLLAQIDKAHIVTGYRRWQAVPGWLRQVGWLWRTLVRIGVNITPEPLPAWLGWRGHAHAVFDRIFFGLRLRDTGCRFCLFRRALFERIPVQSEGDFAHEEILAKANFLGAMMTDVVVPHQPRGDRRPEPFGRWWRDFRRLLSHPSFGPTHLGQGSQWASLQPVP